MAVYLLIGNPPLEAELDRKTFTLYGAIARSENGTMQELSLRQRALGSRYSWFQAVLKKAAQYEIDLDLASIDKKKWKALVDTSIDSYWLERLLSEAVQKSTLSLFRLEDQIKGFQCNPLWVASNLSKFQVKAGNIRAKLITKTYPLQQNLVRMHLADDPTCPLCQREAEDEVHVIMRCDMHTVIRKRFMSKLFSVLHSTRSETSEYVHSHCTVSILNGPVVSGQLVELEFIGWWDSGLARDSACDGGGCVDVTGRARGPVSCRSAVGDWSRGSDRNVSSHRISPPLAISPPPLSPKPHPNQSPY